MLGQLPGVLGGILHEPARGCRVAGFVRCRNAKCIQNVYVCSEKKMSVEKRCNRMFICLLRKKKELQLYVYFASFLSEHTISKRTCLFRKEDVG